MSDPNPAGGLGSPQRADDDWWRGAVIYQIYPRSFQDTTGDGVGDLPGIARRLPYVADLGVDAIWIAPFFVSPMNRVLAAQFTSCQSRRSVSPIRSP